MNIRVMMLFAFLAIVSTSVNAEDIQRSPIWLKKSIKYDWLQLTSGEWLKGDIHSLYNGVLTFDSDKLGIQEIEWEDIDVLKSSQEMTVLLNSGGALKGILTVARGEILIELDSSNVSRWSSSEIISIAPFKSGLFSRWQAKIGASTNIRHGNSEQNDLMLKFSLKHRGVRTRILLDAMASEGEVDDEKVEKNERVSSSLDWFLSKRWFLRPLQLSYFSDAFQNIETRINYSAAVGYYLYDNDNVDWDVYIGPGYQYTKYDAVLAGTERDKETAITAFGTLLSINATDDIDFDIHYQGIAMSEQLGKLSHHLDIGLSVDIFANLDLDVHYILDYLDKPSPDEEGIIPEKRDSELVIGLSLEFN